MATHDYIISNASGASVRADLNNALAAIVSNNSNATSPATTYAYQWWADTTTGQLKLRNSANSAWITIFELDGTMLMEDGTVSAPGLAFASDLNTGFFRSAADKINFATGGAERLEIGSSEVVFNDPSNDVDFRVESNGQAHMLYVDAGNDRVGIGTSSPGTDLDVNNGSANCTIRARTATGFSSFLSLLPNGSGTGVQLASNSDSSSQLFNQLNSYLAFGTNNTERVRILAGGGLTFNGDTAAANALDDYEEGTWTPVATDTSNWSGFASSTVTVNSATYTKIGRTVHIQSNINFSDSTGNLTVGDFVRLDGLPFNYGGSGDNTYNSTASQVMVRDQTNGGVGHSYLISSNEVYVRVVAVHGAAARNQTALKLSFTYFTD